MKERIFSDEYNESLFAKAVGENLRRTIAEESAAKDDFSERHNARMEKILAGEMLESSKYIKIEQLPKRKKTPVWAKRIAAVFILAFAVATGYFMSLPRGETALAETDLAETSSAETFVPADDTANVIYGPVKVVTGSNTIFGPDNAGSENNTSTTTFYVTGKVDGDLTMFPTTRVQQIYTPDGSYYLVINTATDETKLGAYVGGVVQVPDDTESRLVIMGDVRYNLYRSKSGSFPSLITWEHNGRTISVSGYYTVTELQDMAKTVENSLAAADTE
jgi:hypothetical protein